MMLIAKSFERYFTNDCKYKEVILAANERIVGLRGKIVQKNIAYYQDFQFVIGMVVDEEDSC